MQTAYAKKSLASATDEQTSINTSKTTRSIALNIGKSTTNQMTVKKFLWQCSFDNELAGRLSRLIALNSSLTKIVFNRIMAEIQLLIKIIICSFRLCY